MKIYVIKSTFVEKEIGFNKQNVWSNLYAVRTEQEARQDCIRFQNESNDEYFNRSYKFIYIYEELQVL